MTAEHGSFDHGAIFNATHQELTAIFADIEPRGQGYKERGGVKVEGTTPRFKAFKELPGYGVESSFTLEQRSYIKNTHALLIALANGMVFSKQEETVPNFTERVEQHFTTPDSEHGFSYALHNALLGLIGDFKKHYPNYMPALDADFKVAGAEGMSLISGFAHLLINAAKDGELTQENLDDYWPVNYSRMLEGHALFTVSHNTVRGQSTGKDTNTEEVKNPYEGWCSGEGIARGLLKQTKQAALNAATKHDIVHNSPHYDTADDFRRHVKQAAAEVAEKYRSA